MYLKVEEQYQNLVSFMKSFFKLYTFWVSFFGSLMQPFWIIYFYDIGLNSTDIGMLMIFLYVGIFASEIPTGAFADIKGRKLSVMVALMGTGVCVGALFFLSNKYLLFFLHFLMGIGTTFSSGAFQAWVGAALKEDATTKYWGELSSYGHVGAFASYLTGTFLVKKGVFRELWLIIGISYLLLCFYVFFVGKEPNGGKSNQKAENYFRIIIESAKYIGKNKMPRLINITSFLFFIGSGIVALMWQPFFVYKTMIDKSDLGIVMCLMSLPYIFGARFAGNISNLLKGEINALGIIIPSLSVPLILWISTTQFPPAIIFFLIYCLFDAIISPSFDSLMNKHFEENMKATLFSFNSMITGFSTILAGLIFGFKEEIGYIGLVIIIIVFYLTTGFFIITNQRRSLKHEK